VNPKAEYPGFPALRRRLFNARHLILDARHLMESILSPGGPRYEISKRFGFAST
jgi:2'-5' RNA ligase